MKNKVLSFILMLVTSVIIAGNTTDKEVPLDPKVKKGTLDNGLTYYIRKNVKPEQRAEFYLFVNAGAVLETPEQNGLAHFCEHMAFNGTENYPDKGVLDYMETIGVKFGHNVNAFTSTDMTVYNLAQVPVQREGVIDSSLLVLHDWAGKVTFSDEEIDKERGVIHEEWRTRRTADFRMRKAINEEVYAGTKYAKHDVIGELDVIDNCDYETLRNFYRSWYRPDLQGIAVVGDIDVALVEEKIKALFSDLKNPANAPERFVEQIPGNKEPIVAVASDKEATRSMVQIYYKHPVPENKDMDYYHNSIKHSLYQMMLNNRLSELTQKPNPPFIYGYTYYGNMMRAMDAYFSVAMAGNNQLLDAIKALTEENERVARFGFEASELERTKKALWSKLEQQYKDRDKVESGKLVWSYLFNFMQDEPIPGIEFEYDYVQKVLPEITVEDLNALAKQWITDENMVVTVNAVEKDGEKIPTKEEILAAVYAAKKKEMKGYEDAVSDKPLIAELPKAGAVVNTEVDNKLGVTSYTLSNGLKVLIKPTDFKDNEILMSAFSAGGESMVEDADVPSASMVSVAMSVNGLGEYDAISLQKKLSDKNVSVRPYIDNLQEGISGNCEKDDLETLLKLTYLQFAEPRDDAQAFASIKQRYSALLANRAADPRYVFSDSVSVILSDHHPRVQPFNIDLLEKADYQKARKIFNERFNDASDFTFVFVGNIDPEEAKPLLEKYLGSLSSTHSAEEYIDRMITRPAENISKEFELEMKVPKSTVFVDVHGDIDYTLKNKVLMDAVDHVLELRYTETIREDEGGAYGVGVYSSMKHYPRETYDIRVQFDCAPERFSSLKAIVLEEIEKIYSQGPSEDNLKKAKEYFLKSRQEKLKTNKFWLNAIEAKEWHGTDVMNEDYVDIVKSLTTKDVQKFAKKHLKGAKSIQLVMKPIE